MRKNATFLPIFKVTHVYRRDIGPLMKDYAEKEGLVYHPRRMLFCSFELTIGTIITPLLLFHLERGPVCTKFYRFVEYTIVKPFKNFAKSAFSARRQGDENPNSSVDAETLNLLANRSYGYQSMDRSHHSITEFMNDEKTHASINTKMFKRLGHINDQLYEVELVKSEI